MDWLKNVGQEFLIVTNTKRLFRKLAGIYLHWVWPMHSKLSSSIMNGRRQDQRQNRSEHHLCAKMSATPHLFDDDGDDDIILGGWLLCQTSCDLRLLERPVWTLGAKRHKACIEHINGRVHAVWTERRGWSNVTPRTYDLKLVGLIRTRRKEQEDEGEDEDEDERQKVATKLEAGKDERDYRHIPWRSEGGREGGRGTRWVVILAGLTPVVRRLQLGLNAGQHIPCDKR